MMLLLGLIGVAAAGLAFVGLGPDDALDDSSDDKTEPQVASEEPVQPIGDLLDPPDTPELKTPDPLPEEGWDATGPLDAITQDADIRFFDETDDRAAGGLGDDYLDGRDGDDVLDGGGGDDTLHGGLGDDLLTGGADNDALFGHVGADSLSGQAGDDLLSGGSGNDLIAGGDGDDALQGGLDDDTLWGGDGADTLFGGSGDDLLDGRSGEGAGPVSDFLNGGAGDDLIYAGADDIVSLGSGADSLIVGDWITPGPAAQVQDFDIDDDNLVIFYDGSGPTPEVEVDQTEDGAQILLDGAPIVTLRGVAALPDDAIALVGAPPF